MEIVDQINKLLSNRQLEPYIQHIRFYDYRNLKDGLEIDFDFPLTVLVGQNGTNKSSILRGLYGAPLNYHTGDFWFSTKVDPILERPAFVCRYFQPDAKQNVEFIKTRIKRKSNPDYWEPSRPLVKYNMDRMPSEYEPEDKGRSKTRWNVVEKNVVFLDFRAQISAFDKYFYHGNLRSTLRRRTKQDVIRARSKNLDKIIVGEENSFLFRGKEKVNRNVVFEKSLVENVSKILGRDYANIRLIEHDLYGDTANFGYSAVMQFNDIKYSEAWAGAGEFSVVKLVFEIMNAPPRSLILLDEPETSLHPGAQKELKLFLLDQIKRDKHQIVVSTHSPFLLEGLPSEAIKILYLDDSKIQVRQRTSPAEAFFDLGISPHGKICVLTEDRLASEIVRFCCETLGEATYSRFEFKNHPGGADFIWDRDIPVYSRINGPNHLVILDGDQNPEIQIPDKNRINGLNENELKNLVKKLKKSKNKTGDDKQYLNFVRDFVFYLPLAIPEDILWKAMKTQISLHDELTNVEKQFPNDTKKRFEELTKKSLGRSDFLSVDSDEIFQFQKQQIKFITEDVILNIANFLKKGVERNDY